MKRSLSVLVSSIVPLLLTACAAEPTAQAPADDAEQKDAFTLPLTTVKITDTTSHTVVATKTILAAGNAAWRESELGNVLANEQLALNSTQITLDADSARQELLVFARDPAEHASTMTNLMEKMAAQPSGLTLFPTFWNGNQAKYDGIAGHPIALPVVLSMVNPAAHTLCFYPPCPSMISSSETSDFWDHGSAPGSAGTPSSFVPGLASPGGKGSVKGLFIMDHGACGQEVPWSELVGAKLDDAWTELKQEIHDNWDIDWGSRNFQGMTSYLDHASGSLTDTRGGLIVTSQFFLKTYLGSDIGIHFSTRYGFKLTNGIVDVTPNVWLHVSGSTDVYERFADKLGKGVPGDIRKEARARQLAPIPAASRAAAKVLLTLGVGLAKTKLGLSDADVSALTTHVTDDANWSNVDGNGNCKPIEGTPTCTFVVKAKRVNMFPDALELVFFDGKDASNSTYALYAGLVGLDEKGGTHLVDQLCTRSIQAQGGSVNSAIDYTKRDYFTQSRGYQKYDP